MAVKVDQRTGSVEGSAKERMLVTGLRAVAGAFRPFNFRGYSRICQKAADAVAPGLEAIVQLNEDTQFSFPLNDVYWVRLITTSFKYEPEVERVLRSLAKRDYTFIDCGANYGYWSSLVSSQEYGGHRAVAVEASASTFQRLKMNAELVGGRYGVERAAIADAVGKTVKLGGAGHASMSILAAAGEEVQTTTIDDLLRRHSVSGPVVIKLDVEGVEIEALRGARDTLGTSPLILYEDHGNDPESKISAHLLAEGWTVYDIEGPTPVRLRTAAEVSALKRNPLVGYNLAAARDDAWLG